MAQQINEITKIPSNSEVIKILNEIIKRYNSLGSIYTFKGSVQTYAELLAIQNPNVGDVYNVVQEDEEHQIAAGSNFVWDGTVWDNLGGSLAGLVQSVNGINPDSLGNVLLPLIKNVTTSQGVMTFTKNDNTTINVDNVKKLYTIMLGESVDLNTLTGAGIYMCGNNGYAANYENCPIQKAFLLEVQADAANDFVFQFLTQYNDGSTEAGNQYTRTYYNNNWSAWIPAGSMPTDYVKNISESNGTVTVAKSDGATNSFNVVTSVNGVTPTGGNVDITGVPTGTILPFAGGTIPSGFLACNGAAVSRTTYSALYSVIGTTYGSGNGSSTFNLPNAESDKFLQGNSTPGTVKAPGLPNITGYVNHTGTSCMRNPGGAFYAYSTSSYQTRNSDGKGIGLGIDASRSNAIYGASDTVQPPALTVRFIIKY